MSQEIFVGIHPYINSWLQTPSDVDGLSGWGAFHAAHVVTMAEVLQESLPAHYVAFAEQSIQLTEWGWDMGQIRRPDVTILQTNPSLSLSNLQNTPTPTMVFDLDDIEPFTEPMKRVVVREFREGRIGKPVTAIELISINKKSRNSGYYLYQQTRKQLFKKGISLVEIDYLHEAPPILPQIPQYPHQANSYPYYALVTDVRAIQPRKTVNVFAFGVDDPIPQIPVPLMGEEWVMFDLAKAYQLTLQRGAWLRLVGSMIGKDYHTAQFEAYHPKDQAWIVRQIQKDSP